MELGGTFVEPDFQMMAEGSAAVLLSTSRRSGL